MQRVRIGIMGLAVVFLLVVLATAVYSLFGNRPNASSGPGTGLASNSAEPPREPLAELGVVPGNLPPETNQATPAASRPGRKASH